MIKAKAINTRFKNIVVLETQLVLKSVNGNNYSCYLWAAILTYLLVGIKEINTQFPQLCYVAKTTWVQQNYELCQKQFIHFVLSN